MTIHALLFGALVVWGWPSLSDGAGAASDTRAGAGGPRRIPISLTSTSGSGDAAESLPEAVTATSSDAVDEAAIAPEAAEASVTTAPQANSQREARPSTRMRASDKPTLPPPVDAAPPSVSLRPETEVTDVAVEFAGATASGVAVSGHRGASAGAESDRRRARDTGKPGDGLAGGDTGKKGPATGSGTGEPAYLVDLQEQVQASLRYARRAQRRGIEGDVVVAVVLDAAGALRQSRVQSSSGKRILDDDALRTARRAAPFGPPPGPLVGIEIEIPVSYGLVGAAGASR